MSWFKDLFADSTPKSSVKFVGMSATIRAHSMTSYAACSNAVLAGTAFTGKPVDDTEEKYGTVVDCVEAYPDVFIVKFKWPKEDVTFIWPTNP